MRLMPVGRRHDSVRNVYYLRRTLVIVSVDSKALNGMGSRLVCEVRTKVLVVVGSETQALRRMLLLLWLQLPLSFSPGSRILQVYVCFINTMFDVSYIKSTTRFVWSSRQDSQGN